jgi:hypothetical protein
MLNLGALLVLTSVTTGQASEQAAPVYPQLEALEQFIGDWEARSTVPDDAPPSELLGPIAGKTVILTTYVRWAPGKCAQVINLTYKIPDTVQILGTGIRAWDQKAQQICEHSFTTHKGTWSGTWKKDGNAWVYEYQGINLDGEKWTGKRVFTFTDKDHYVLKDIEQTCDGEPRPDAELALQRCAALNGRRPTRRSTRSRPN